MLKTLTATVCLALIGLSAAANLATDPAGVLEVIDGDTVDVGGIRVRLFGIDAPEMGQLCTDAAGVVWPCGAWSAGRVAALYQGNQAECTALDTDRYGRTVARCLVEGLDIGAILVGAGVATAYRDYSDAYAQDEAAAKAAGLGIWAGEMEPPAAFRARDVSPPPATDCAIKGNISDAGRIYHLPGGGSYADTRIDTDAGERWFCSTADAEAAGWRAARN